MRNNKKFKTESIFSVAKELPYFELEDLLAVEKNKIYLKIILSRYKKNGKVISLKKGIYVTKDYIDATKIKGELSSYSEMIANKIYQPSYLSLEYVLYQHNLLTEIPTNFTSISLAKTYKFSNDFGNFYYRRIKKNLFLGFELDKKGEFWVAKATKAKALFDFLYLRKNDLINKDSAIELRLNLNELNKEDKKELENYFKIEGSIKMKKIFNFLF